NCRVEEVLPSGLLRERREEIGDAGRAVREVRHEARERRVHRPLQPSARGNGELVEAFARPRGEVARGRGDLGVALRLAEEEEADAGAAAVEARRGRLLVARRPGPRQAVSRRDRVEAYP